MSQFNGEELNALASMGGVSVLGAISRTIITEDRRTITGFLRGLVCAIFVVYLVGCFIKDYALTDGLSNFIVGVSAFVADDILLLLLKTGRMVTRNPGAALDWLIALLTGLRKDKYKK
jgi:hypothetical protein